MEISDNHIVEQVRQGDVEAYAELVQRYQKCIFNLMYRFSYTRGDAAELTQDVFCKAYEKLNSFQNNRTFFPWLYTLAVNHGREWSRKQERKKNGIQLYTDSLTSEELLLPLDIVEKKQELVEMFTALDQLPYEKREILLLRYQQELSIADIAKIFDLSHSAVKMRISRSLAILQHQLSGETDVNQ